MPNDIWQHCSNSCYNPVTRNQLDCTPPSIPFCPSLSVHDLHLFISFFRACCNSKSFLLEPPAASVLSESFLWAQKKKKCANQLATGQQLLIAGEEREGARQTITTTTTLATENKSIQLIVCAAVKVCVCVCVCECKSLINTIFYNCSVIYVCVYVRLLVLIECNIEKIIEIEKKYEKNQIQQLQLQ